MSEKRVQLLMLLALALLIPNSREEKVTHTRQTVRQAADGKRFVKTSLLVLNGVLDLFLLLIGHCTT